MSEEKEKKEMAVRAEEEKPGAKDKQDALTTKIRYCWQDFSSGIVTY